MAQRALPKPAQLPSPAGGPHRTRLVDVERVMMALECIHIVVKKQGECFIHAHRCEVTVHTLEAQSKKLSESPRRCLLVVCRND